MRMGLVQKDFWRRVSRNYFLSILLFSIAVWFSQSHITLGRLLLSSGCEAIAFALFSKSFAYLLLGVVEGAPSLHLSG